MKRLLALLVLLLSCSSRPPEDCVAVAAAATSNTELRIAKFVNPCTVDDDCMLFVTSLSCYSGCPTAISRSREEAAKADLAALSQVVCSETMCEVKAGCLTVFAQCRSGRCTTVEGASDGGAGDGGMRDGG